jgi:two-component system cell cycle sensor histidine kinase/response regulator CckA
MLGESSYEAIKNRLFCDWIWVPFFLLIAVFLPPHPSADSAVGADDTYAIDVADVRNLLDSSEINWLNSHPVLRVAGPRAFPPFHFYDVDGHVKGMACDYLDLIAARIGLKIDEQRGLPWPEVLTKAMDKEIDVINSAAQSPEREAYLLFSVPILSFPIVIITRKNAPFIGGIDDLRGMKLAFVKESVVFDWLRRDRIAVEPHFVGTPLEALTAVSLGTADAHIENLAAAGYLIEKNGLINLKIAAPTPYQNYTLHVAVRKDWPELVSIINKTIHALSPEQHTSIRNKWLTVRYEFGIRMEDIWKWVIMIAIPVLIAIMGITLWNSRLQKEIVERQRAEESLRNSEERLRMIAENTGSLIAVLDKTGRYEFANPAHWKLGWDPGELIGTSGFHLIHPDDRDRLSSIFQTGITEELSTFTVEYRIVDKEGMVYSIEGKFDSIRSSEGMIEKIVFVGDDITERKQFQESLTREREVLAMVINGMRAGTWEWYIQSGKTVFNERWAEIVGYTLEELQPVSIQTWIDLCHPEDLKLSDGLLKAHFSGELPYYECECRMRHKTGYWAWILVRGKVVKMTETGQPMLMVGTHVDITRRKQAEAEQAAIDTQNRQLQKAESLSRMAGAIAHHFNNQLHVVLGNIELAMEDQFQGKAIDKLLLHALQSARKASDVSALMLTYLGQTSGKPEVIDLSETCRLNFPMLKAAIPMHVSLDSDLPASGPVIFANPSHIQQILTHLITNAWESMTDGRAEIHLTVETYFPEAIPRMHRFPIDWKPADSLYACVSVTDTGSGIAEKDIETLFDPFFTTKFTGRGLGLSVIIGIVRAYNGAITVQSEPGQGSVFQIFLPVSDQIVSTHVDYNHEAHPLDVDGTVLLVEDDEMVCEIVAEMFSHMGIRVIQAGDGIDALAMFRQHSDEIRCVLTDMTMPRMGGWELISALKSMRADIPIILASGYDEALVLDGRHPDQPQAFLHKPYSMNELKQVLLRVL